MGCRLSFLLYGKQERIGKYYFARHYIGLYAHTSRAPMYETIQIA
jgi:hypothetical protein